MNEQHRGGMGAGLQVALLLAGAVLFALCFAIWQIGSEFLRTLALILVSALAIGIVLVASAIPIRMWRRKDFTGDHYHTDGTRTIIKETRVLDGRVAEGPKLYQLPAQAQGTAFPELLRAAYSAGQRGLSARGTAVQGEPEYVEAELREVGLDDGDGWAGDIRT